MAHYSQLRMSLFPVRAPARGVRLEPPSCVWTKSDTIETLKKKTEDAALALNFEQATRCRNMINAIRMGATAVEAEQADFTGLKREQPGVMGLGTSQQKITPPAGWRAPPKPDLMTSGGSSRGKGRK
jgi:hypothetical protein